MIKFDLLKEGLEEEAAAAVEEVVRLLEKCGRPVGRRGDEPQGVVVVEGSPDGVAAGGDGGAARAPEPDDLDRAGGGTEAG